ncbi:MAG: endolytic transglycosylase MltG [Dechloromonas sp.]|nr:MAG: endolytic transglycosylase MltG [Dechloromonas sp.]
MRLRWIRESCASWGSWGLLRGFGILYRPLIDARFRRARPACRLRVPVRPIIKLFVLFCVVLGVIAGYGWWWSQQALTLKTTPVDFRIPPGTGLRGAIGQIQAAGVDVNANALLLLARVGRAEAAIKAGSYSVAQGITPAALLEKLVQGKVTQGEATLVEGWTFRQWRARLDKHPDLRHDTAGLSEQEIIQRLGLKLPKLEGWLFPDTYLFDKQSSDLDLLARAHRSMQGRLATEWAARSAGLPYRNPEEALVMASIVEKETGRDADRGQVAAVFVNRLRKGMLLQTDPTVIYGLDEQFDGNLRKRDLQTDTPYNTYTRAGLPPTPISMPGSASLRAALNPPASDALYFVARGDGSSQFSRTLDEHNQAVNRYQRGQK